MGRTGTSPRVDSTRKGSPMQNDRITSLSSGHTTMTIDLSVALGAWNTDYDE